MTATCLGVLLTMLSWSTSGMGRENANEEFKEFEEYKECKEYKEYKEYKDASARRKRWRGGSGAKNSSYSWYSSTRFISKHLNIGACRLDRMGKR
jgi:hypothetical protein